MLTTILPGFTTQPVENLFLATARVLGLPVGSVERLGLAVKSHVLWAVYRASGGGRCSTFIGRRSFSGFHLEVGDRAVTVTNLEKGTEYQVHPKSRPNSEALDKNVYCTCPDYRFNRRGGSPCKHIFEAIARVGGQIGDWVEQIKEARIERQRRLEVEQEERDRKRAELEKAADAWEIKKFEITNGYEPAPGFSLTSNFPGFDVFVELKSHNPRTNYHDTQYIGSIVVNKSSGYFSYISRCYANHNFPEREVTPENVAIACQELFKISEYANEELWIRKPYVQKASTEEKTASTEEQTVSQKWLTEEYFRNIELGNSLPF